MRESFVSKTATIVGAVALVAIATAMIIMSMDAVDAYAIPKGFHSQIDNWADNARHDRVIELCRNRLLYNPREASTLWYLGVALDETGQREEAKSIFLKIKELAGTNECPAVDEHLVNMQSPQKALDATSQ